MTTQERSCIKNNKTRLKKNRYSNIICSRDKCFLKEKKFQYRKKLELLMTVFIVDLIFNLSIIQR